MRGSRVPNFIASDDSDERRRFGYLLLEFRCAVDCGHSDLHQIFDTQGAYVLRIALLRARKTTAKDQREENR